MTDLIKRLVDALTGLLAFLAGREDARKSQQLEDAQNALETRERVDAAADASGMSDVELAEYMEKRGRLRKGDL